MRMEEEGGTKSLDNMANAWQAKALRRAMRLPHSMISHTTNESVLDQANAAPIAHRIKELRVIFVHALLPPGR